MTFEQSMSSPGSPTLWQPVDGLRREYDNSGSGPAPRSNRNSDGQSRTPASTRKHEPLSFEPKLTVKEEFAKLDTTSKCLLKSVMEKISRLKDNSSPAATGLRRSNGNKNKTELNIQDEEISIRELFADLRDCLAQMKSLSGDMSSIQTNKNLSPRILDQIKTYELTVTGLHSSIRKLQLEFQQIMNVKKREDLLSLSTSPFDNENSLASLRNRRGTGPGSISTNTTDSLLKTRNILMETVQKSTGTLEQLAQSSLTIVNSQEDLKEQNTIVGASRKLLSKYGRREWTDRVLICLGLVFFFAVVGYILQKRLF